MRQIVQASIPVLEQRLADLWDSIYGDSNSSNPARVAALQTLNDVRELLERAKDAFRLNQRGP
jgi:hypothetical protein